MLLPDVCSRLDFQSEALQMKLLQRYLFAELVRVFSLLVVALTVMLVFVGLFQEATQRGLGAMQILQIMPFVVPSMLPFTIPATLLLAVCIVYGRVSGDLEVIAAKAAGISAMQMLYPAFALGAILSVGSFSLTNYVIPWAVGNIEQIVTQAMEDIFLDILATQHMISDADRGYSITVHEVRDRTLIDATFRYRTSNHQQLTLRAEAARIHFDLENEEIRLLLKNAVGSRPGSDSAGELDTHELSFPLPREIRNVAARHLTLSSLKLKVAELQRARQVSRQQLAQQTAVALLTGDFELLNGDAAASWRNTVRSADRNERKFRTEVYGRFSMAASCLFFAFVGGPFSILQARRQFMTSFIICFLPILIVYYPTMFLMINLCKTGTIQPVWAMWVPNAILLLAGTLICGKVIRY
jgi:lipopolysaccharide export system permease protein